MLFAKAIHSLQPLMPNDCDISLTVDHETQAYNVHDLDKGSAYKVTSSLENHSAPSAMWPPKATVIPVPETQRAIITPKMGKELGLVLRELPVQHPAPGEVVVRIFYSGICRSDASFSIGPEPGYPKYNHIAGHEGIGRIVESHDLSLIGRAVGIRYLGSTCGWCTYCSRGILTSCPFQLNTPKHNSGTFQFYATIPISSLVYLPDELLTAAVDPAFYATALCSGSTALMSLRAAKLKPGDVLVVIGAMGAIGHMTGAIAKHVLRTHVIGIDIRPKVEPLPNDYSDYCDILLSAPQTTDDSTWSKFHAKLLDEFEQLRCDKSLPRKAEAVIVSSSSFSAFRRLDDYVCDGGRIVCVGIPKGHNMLQISLNCIVERNLHLTGTLMGGQGEALEVMEYIRSGAIKPHVTKVAIEDIPDQMQRLVDCRTVGKVVACFN